MPIYEFRCRDCHRKVTLLTLRVSERVEAVCEHCGSRKLDRLLSRVALLRSNDQRLDELSDDADPKSMGRWMRKMGDELGPDAGEDFDELVEGIERGDDDQAPDDDGSDA